MKLITERYPIMLKMNFSNQKQNYTTTYAMMDMCKSSQTWYPIDDDLE